MNYPAPNPPYLGPPAHSSAGNNLPATRIVMHGTVSPCVRGGARETALYFRNPASGGSAHYTVDPGEVIQATYDSVIAWHAPPNANSFGVELCDLVADPKTGKALPMSRWDDPEHQAMLNLAAHLVAQLCLAYGVPVQLVGPLGLRAGKHGICEHSDVSEAWHQSDHWDLGNFPRRQFVQMVAAQVKAIKAGRATPSKPAPAPKVSRVTRARDILEQAARNVRKKVRKARIQKALADLPGK